MAFHLKIFPKLSGDNTNDKDVYVSSDAVVVEKAVACYSKDINILDGLSMRVRKGTIYALLGPSGCGKTTLLLSILGRKQLKSGDISVFNGSPGDRNLGLPGGLVGYMPQDICLYVEFTIEETFQYFGRLQKMGKDLVQKKQQELLDLLDLPEASRGVGTLSGGQKRRLSFAVALLHNPKILILDEPTVGVDPVVRARIWSHLQTLALTGTSIIITTHYIEEARDAHTVGIMRCGRLLAQEPPGVLMERYQAQTLEKVFLSLCIATEKSDPDIMIADGRAKSIQSISTCWDDNENMNVKLINKKVERSSNKIAFPSLSNIGALFIKNWITMKRNILLLLFIFFLPGLVLMLNSVLVGHEPENIPIAVVNVESSCNETYYLTGCEANLLGCYFKHALEENSHVKVISYDNITQAEEDTRNRLVRGTIIIPENFSVSYLKKILSPSRFDRFLFYFSESDDKVQANDTISVSLDASDTLLDLYMKKAVSESWEEVFKSVSSLCREYLGDQGLDLKAFHIIDPLLGHESSDYRDLVTPGLIATSLYFLAMSLTAESFISERSQGLLERSWISGVLPGEIVASYVMSQFLVMLMQAVIALITVFAVFSIPCHGPISWFVVLTISQGFVGMSFGIFLSTICDTSADAMKLAIGAWIPQLLLGGIFWPLEGMPQVWTRQFARVVPHTEAVQGMRDIMLRGWGIMESSSIWYGLGITSAWTFIFLFLSWILVTKKLSH